MAKIDDELKELKTLEERLSTDLRLARARIRERELAIIERDRGLAPGVVVRSEGSLFKIVAIIPRSYGVELKGHKQIKGGSFSPKRLLRIWGEVEVVEGVENDND